MRARWGMSVRRWRWPMMGSFGGLGGSGGDFRWAEEIMRKTATRRRGRRRGRREMMEAIVVSLASL